MEHCLFSISLRLSLYTGGCRGSPFQDWYMGMTPFVTCKVRKLILTRKDFEEASDTISSVI